MLSLNYNKCAPCRDLPTLQFWSKSDYPSWSSCPFFIKFKDYFIKILFLLSKWFQTRRFLLEFLIGSYVNLSSAVAAKNHFLWNYWANLNQTLLKWSLGGPLPKLCPAFQNTDQDGSPKSIFIFFKFDEKRARTPRWVIRFTSKLQGR
jgi:hypothetical protein